MSDDIRSELAANLARLRSIGREIAALQAESKDLRKSLLCHHESLPKKRDDDSCAMIVTGDWIAYLRPVTKEDSDKVIDATVTFDPVFVAN